MTARRAPRRTSRATAEEALEPLLGLAGVGVYRGVISATMAQDAVTQEVGGALRSILGYPEDASAAAIALFDPRHLPDPLTRETLLLALISEQRVCDYLVQGHRLDGSSVWMELTVHAVPDSVPSRLVVSALVRDVSDRRRREDRAKEAIRELAESEHLAALGRTLAGAAHELRNPLATILNWAERLDEGDLDPKVRRGVQEILGASVRAERLVRSLLHSAARRQSTRELVDVNAVVKETLELRLDDQRAMNVTATADLSDDLLPVLADAHQLQQVVLNLLINAEQAMVAASGRGRLSVVTRCENSSVLIRVSDDGPGVPPTLRARIFDPFFTTKQPGSGTGLGLAVAHSLVMEHGGRLWLDEQAHSGATFVVSLPGRARA